MDIVYLSGSISSVLCIIIANIITVLKYPYVVLAWIPLLFTYLIMEYVILK